MDRCGLPFVQSISRDETMMSLKEVKGALFDINSEDWADINSDPSLPFLKPMKTYGSHLGRDEDVLDFEERCESKEWDIDDHKISLKELLHRYDTDSDWGLSETLVLKNLERYEENLLTPPPKPSKLWKLVMAVFGGLNALLWRSATLSFLSYSSASSPTAQFLYTDLISNENPMEELESLIRLNLNLK